MQAAVDFIGIGSGRLHICRPRALAISKASGGTATLPTAPPPTKPPRLERKPAESKKDKTKTWIEIKLVDDHDRPVPGEKYRVLFSDGSMREGSLDAQGGARFEGIDAGVCQVSFPNLAAGNWKAA